VIDKAKKQSRYADNQNLGDKKSRNGRVGNYPEGQNHSAIQACDDMKPA
jgi:hypothetical protein